MNWWNELGPSGAPFLWSGLASSAALAKSRWDIMLRVNFSRAYPRDSEIDKKQINNDLILVVLVIHSNHC